MYSSESWTTVEAPLFVENGYCRCTQIGNNQFSKRVQHGKSKEWREQLGILFDCDTTRGRHHSYHIIEVAAIVIVPDNISVTKEEFSSLCCSSEHTHIQF